MPGRPRFPKGGIGGQAMRIIRGLIIPAAILALGIAGFMVLAASKTPPERAEARSEAPLVEVAHASSGAAEGFEITVNGTVVPRRVIRLAAEIEGRVIEKSGRCEPGYSVLEGDVLLRIDPTELEIRRKGLRAELAQIRADLEQLDVEEGNTRELIDLADRDLDLADRERNRTRALAQRNSVSQTESDAADRELLAAQRSLQTLRNEQNTVSTRRAKLEALAEGASATLEQVDYDLERATIRAPADGLIVEAPVERGGYVRTGDILAQLEDSSTLEVRCNLQMDDLYWLAKSHPSADPPVGADLDPGPYRIPPASATIRYSLAGETVTWPGRLSRFEGGGIDERTRTVPCRVAIPPDQVGAKAGPLSLRRGMFVSVTLRVEDPSVALRSIPAPALRPNGEVWTVRDGLLRIGRVEVIRRLDDRVIIRDARGTLRGDDLLIVSPLTAPVDGMQVRLIEGRGPGTTPVVLHTGGGDDR